MSFQVDVKGVEQLERALSGLPGSVKRRKMLSLIRRSSKQMLAAAKLGAPKGETGNLQKSIGNITGRSKENPTSYIGARVKRGYKGYHAHFIEEGTQQRKIKKAYIQRVESVKIYHKAGENRGHVTGTRFMKEAYLKSKTGTTRLLEKNTHKLIQQLIAKI